MGRGAYRLFWCAALLAIPFRPVNAQEASDNSLGDLARETRAQHATTQGKSGNAQQLVDEMQQEQEASDNAPVGFKSYDAGAYRLFVPYPYSLEGRDNGGAILLGSRLGLTNTEVLAGTPIPLPSGLKDSDLGNFLRQFAQRYSPNISCIPSQPGAHKVFRCNMGRGNLLGHDVSGSMEFVVASGSVIPIMCASPDDLNQCVVYSNNGYRTCGNRRATWDDVQSTQKAIMTRYDDQRTTAQVCDQVIYPSVQLKEDIVVHPASIGNKAAKPAAATEPVATTEEPSLADLARQSRQAGHPKAQATLDNAEGAALTPAGFQSYILQYCQHPQQCSEATVLVPENAEVVSRINGQHIFKTKLGGDPVLLYAGPADVNAPYRGMSDGDFIRIRDLANSNGWSREQTDGVSTQELTIEGHPALTTRFRYHRDNQMWWVGERTLIEIKNSPYETPGLQFLVGCTAPEQRFADAEAWCTTLLNSLRLP